MQDDARGTDLADQIDQSTHGVANDLLPTRITADCQSSPDITLVSALLFTSTEWSTRVALNSDHIPIVISVQRSAIKCESDRSCYTNFTKTNWNGFREFTEEQFATVLEPKNIHLAEKTFRTILINAARKFIPAGSFKEIRPNFPTIAARLADQRDALRATEPGEDAVV